MSDRRHATLTDPRLGGFPYGMQRDLEAAISRRVGATAVEAPPPWPPRIVQRFSAPGTRYARLLAVVPKRQFLPEADDLWVVLMGPEDFPLWYYTGWDRRVGRTRLYLFDTLDHQLPTLRRLLAAGRWDQLVTSFPDAVPKLETATGRRWSAVLQGVSADRFHPLPSGAEPAIAFSSYGRRHPSVHAAIRRFCRDHDLHYDYTVAAGLQPGLDPIENYAIYAWHLRQSWFTVGWPVEVTHPTRAGSFSPVTCRWFEAAASGAVVVGAAPTDPAFEEAFGQGFVEPLDPHASADTIMNRLGELWNRRYELRANRLAIAAERGHTWTWDARVAEMAAV